MTFLNKTQLGFILDIKAEAARAKMCYAWASENKIINTAYADEKEKIIDPYPETMRIEILAQWLNLPTLQQSVDDIVNNYTKRPATKKWIFAIIPKRKSKKQVNQVRRYCA